MNALVLATILAAPRPAFADDLELTITLAGPSGEAMQAMTLHDVVEGRQPGLVLETPDGDRSRLELTLELLEKPRKRDRQQVLVVAEIYELQSTDEGQELATLVSSPRLVTMANQPASIQQGESEETGEGLGLLVRGMRVEMVYVTER